MAIDTDTEILSTSLVTRLNSSPRWRVSKYDSGNRWTFFSTSDRNVVTVRATMVFSSRA